MWKVCWSKGRLYWRIAKLFHFCHLSKLVRPETYGPYHVPVCYYILASFEQVWNVPMPWFMTLHRSHLLLLLEALQLQRSFGLLNQFLPFVPVSDAFLPVCYFQLCYVALYIVFPSIFRPSYRLVCAGDNSHTFLPCWCLAYDVHVRTRLIQRACSHFKRLHW